MRESDPYQELLRMRSPKNVDMVFDLICARNWFSGNMKGNIPTDENRILFNHLKKLIRKGWRLVDEPCNHKLKKCKVHKIKGDTVCIKCDKHFRSV